MSSSHTPTSCECCLLPFSRDPLGESRESPRYCSYCYSGGELHAEKVRDLEEFQSIVYENMRKIGHSWIFSRLATWSIRFAPYWRSRKQNHS